ncbi:hypothetical protein BJF93_12435 [Xaviernesmea oryzae]|uniref:AB hydrolase-1 domain-containing protein n=1 Tax=Xaviernesmea oryzae TaxID=464029 RepID=A0A1Q9B3J0_9HYPH|nr:alpha/beta hydrolase [Xaviernesmea oryzae]OLP62611.1 hypothetical protein BJF93_12435 [Xaviernesmea oryzae]SEM25878.1 Pimeloyl-ACP methyl ester carboxylesterase [Xaviernesmea oryzae]
MSGDESNKHWLRLPDGRRIRYAAFGETGPVLVLLHGLSDSGRSFDTILPALRRHVRIIVPDQRGHGESDPASDYAVEAFAADAASLITATGGAPVHLLGHSLGAIVAQRVAARHPEQVVSLTLIGGARTAAGHPGLLDLADALAGFGAEIPRDFIEAFQRGTLFRAIADERFALFVSESLKLRPETWRAAVDGLLADTDPPPSLRADLPVLALFGDRDAVFGKAEQARLGREIPQARLVTYRDVGHAPHWEVPDDVVRDLVAFLRQVTSSETASQEEDEHAKG